MQASGRVKDLDSGHTGGAAEELDGAAASSRTGRCFSAAVCDGWGRNAEAAAGAIEQIGEAGDRGRGANRQLRAHRSTACGGRVQRG
uniref:Uncharacterized protein n=1 Tax=Leersia perrieri TaxID=77586 RepID=A0A0D9Y1E6_9ORYZ